jgi:hypothetical protein
MVFLNLIMFFSRLEENANLSSSHSPRQYTTFGDKYAAAASGHHQAANGGPGYHHPPPNGGPGYHHPPANGGPGYPASILKKRVSSGQEDGGGQFEAKNDEVIRRVAEMKQILQVIYL